MNNSVRIFVVCFVGAFTGSFISLEVNPKFWWVGAMVGAGIAYLSFNPKEVVIAIKTTFRRMVDWRHNTTYWTYWREDFADVFNVCFNILLGSILLLMSIACINYGPSEVVMFIFADMHFFGLVFLCYIALCSVLGLIFAFENASSRMDGNRGKIMPNFFRMYFWLLPFSIFTGLTRLITYLPTGIEIVGSFMIRMEKFIVTFFTLIHSELGLLCALDTALGAGIGYFAGNALIGAFAGAMFGFLNYEIFSVRVFKLEGCKSIFK